jgi:hypothetical protein
MLGVNCTLSLRRFVWRVSPATEGFVACTRIGSPLAASVRQGSRSITPRSMTPKSILAKLGLTGGPGGGAERASGSIVTRGSR